MASVHIVTRTTSTGRRRYRVRFRLGGREAPLQYAGTFPSRKLAEKRARWVHEKIAAMQVPDLRALSHPLEPLTVAEVAEQWQASRIDVAASTAEVHRKSLAHVLARFGAMEPGEVTPAQVAAWIRDLASDEPPTPPGVRKRTAPYSVGSIRKMRDALAMVLAFHGVQPNPARDDRVKLPRDRPEEIEPPEADAVEAVLGAVARRYVLPLLVLDATACGSPSSRS